MRVGSIDENTRAGMVELAGGMLEALGRFMQKRATPPDRFGPNDAWIPDKQDHEMIGGSLANLAARRMPSGLGGEGDVADLLGLTVGTAGYVSKNAQKTAALHRIQGQGAWSSLEGNLPDGDPGPFAGNESGLA